MADVVLSSTENNDGTYLLQGSATNSLTAGTGYTLVLTDGSTSVTSNSFVVVNPRTISSVQTSPSACVVGQACSISFTLGGGVSSVSLVYSGMSTGVVVSSTTSNPYAWTVPGSVTPGTYTITLTDTTNSAVTGTTGTFTIEAAPSLTVVSPTGASRWTRGIGYNVMWSSTGTLGALTLTMKKSGSPDVVLTTTGTYIFFCFFNFFNFFNFSKYKKNTCLQNKLSKLSCFFSRCSFFFVSFFFFFSFLWSATLCQSPTMDRIRSRLQ